MIQGKDITSEELGDLIASCRNLMRISSADFQGPKQFLFRLMLMPEIRDK